MTNLLSIEIDIGGFYRVSGLVMPSGADTVRSAHNRCGYALLCGARLAADSAARFKTIKNNV